MITNKQLADLIFPDITETVDDLEKRYPPRNLPEGAQVTRFAPSPTGFVHMGSLLSAFEDYKIAKDSNVEPEKPNKIFETKEYDINVVLDEAKVEKKENYEEDKARKIRDTQFDILKDLDIDEKPLDGEDKVINHNKSSEL